MEGTPIRTMEPYEELNNEPLHLFRQSGLIVNKSLSTHFFLVIIIICVDISREKVVYT